MSKVVGKVYLTGAGPGDMDLLTVKALKLIEEADVLVYDKLINPLILRKCKKGCSKIFVGKEISNHSLPQEDINELLYKLSCKFKRVVRLKGGDPLVFGRGSEEALYLKSKGVEFEFIPGITSAVSVPQYAGIPVTHRGVATSFRVITGHEANKKKSQIDWNSFKNENETLIFLMGLHRIDKIANKLLEIGRAKDLPVAVISNGTSSKQEVVVGTLEDIAYKAIGMPTPALIIVGKVVELRDELSWFK